MPHANKKMISFFLTTKCNLCCRYCYNAWERNMIEEKTLPLEIAYAGINWYFSSQDSRHIRFYGPGEPTQEFTKLKEITRYARSYEDGGERVTVEIQTNGIFTEDVRRWILDNVNIVWMSFDGMPNIQNFNRPLNPKYKKIFNNQSSAVVIEKNTRWLIENITNQDLMVGARATITNENIARQMEMVDYFASLGIRYVWTDPLFASVGTCPVCADHEKVPLHFDMDAYIDNHLKASLYAKSKGVFWKSFFSVNFDGQSPYHCRCCTPLSAPHLTPDGYISSCDMVVLGERPYHMSPFIVGKWNPDNQKFEMDEQKIFVLRQRNSTNMIHCKECPVKLHCGGYCLGETLNETGNLFGQNIEKCKAIIKLFENEGICPPYEYLHP